MSTRAGDKISNPSGSHNAIPESPLQNSASNESNIEELVKSLLRILLLSISEI